MFVRRTTTKAVNGSHSIMKMGQVRTMGTIPQDTKNTFVKFDFMDGLNMNNLLDEEEQMIVDQVKAYAQEELMPRVKEGYRTESFDPKIMRELGELGTMGATIKGYGCSGVSSVAYGLIARELER
eukprot:TRINITY_DN3323_c1_g1_i8.p1 TRINITY_DN3323_c1_g1~~TRINITY_DN3323_c1_g1_i8.p1  ORF type:complete len:132 (+),score=42.48 TRINITY_DN3323_c1_g1_i8:23-397(+)